jgi:hypothetical protein
MAGVITEYFSDVVKESLMKAPGFLSAIPDLSANIKNGVFNVPEAGNDPTVGEFGTIDTNILVDRVDSNLAIPLRIATSTTTKVSNAEQIQTKYDKVLSVTKGHKKSILKYIAKWATWNLSPNANTTKSPVFATSGALIGAGAAQRREMTEADIIKLAGLFETLEVPEEDRILVLHGTHYMQLLANSQTFKNMVSFRGALGDLSPKIEKTFGHFEVYTYSDNAIYNATTGVKKVFGAAPAATDAISSFAFSRDEVYKAFGDNEMFYTPKDTRAQGDIMNFQQAYLASPARANNAYTAAIFSANS